jgi:hypothetical protein
MKMILLTFLAPLALQAAEPLVTCKLSDFKMCKDCSARIPTSCEENAFLGSLNTSTKPAKIQWLVSNPKNGTEQVIITDNKTLAIKDLQKAKDLKALAIKQKVKAQSSDKVALVGIQVPAKTDLFKAQSGKEIAAQMKVQTPARSIASDTKEIHAGGVGRSQKLKEKK